jgi:hypothetical protein
MNIADRWRSAAGRLIYPAILALAFAANAKAETQDEHFHRIDTNRDGFVSYDEHSAALDTDFRAIDANGDDKLSVDEYAAYLARKTPRAPAAAMVSVARCFFKTVKPDNNGTLSHAEWKGFHDRTFKWLADGGDRMTLEQSKRVPPPDVIPRMVCR